MVKFLSHLKHKWVLVALAVVGILLVLVGGAVSGNRGEDEGTAAGESVTADGYRRSLETDLAAFCRAIDGVGEVKVMVTMREGENYAYSSGKLVSTELPKVEGVAVLCEGGDSARVRQEVVSALSALLDIGSHKIYVGKLT